MKNRELAGVKVFVSNEAYDEYKGTLQEQIKKLQSNWNSLREWLKEEYKKYDIGTKTYGQAQVEETLNKMKELEGEDNE